MAIQPRVESRPRWKVIRTENKTMDRNVYLGNDHQVDIRIEERTTGRFTSGLSLTASLSRNPTGSAIASFFLDGGTASFVSASQHDLSTVQIISGPATQSIFTATSQSLFTNFTGSVQGNVTLQIPLTESPVCSGQYVGIIPGLDINTALSQSLSSSFSQTDSGSIASASLDVGGLIISAGITTSVAFTASITGITQSFTASILNQLAESEDRCFGVFEIIQSGSFLKATTPMTLRSARFLS